MVHFDISLYDTYVKGYLEGTGDVLTQEEKKSALGGKTDDIRVWNPFPDRLSSGRHLL